MGAHAVAAVVLTMFGGDQKYYESLEIIKSDRDKATFWRL
jgi:hypothetical protein